MDYPRIWSKQLCSGVQREASQGHRQRQLENSNFQGPIECLTKKQMEKLAKKSKVKQPKLLSSKSLSLLVPRSLFFKKSSNVGKQVKNDGERNKVNNLVATKSFPTSSSYQQKQQHQRSATSLESSSSFLSGGHEQFIGRVNSASMIGIPRQSSSSTFAVGSNNSSMEQPNLSPIVIGSQQMHAVASNENGNEVVDMSWTEIGPTGGDQSGQKGCGQTVDKPVDDKNTDEGRNEKRKADENNEAGGGKFRPLRNTALVLRDVKNSIGLRMKAKHESQAFAKLTNEQATPPTKLYSPFNIYTDSCTKDPNYNSGAVKRLDMNLASKLTPDDFKTPNKDQGEQQQDTATVKGRIAFQHKKHLMQANKFTFDSPTGRLRETVKDVEHFQQCIEDISKAIKARDSL